MTVQSTADRQVDYCCERRHFGLFYTNDRYRPVIQPDAQSACAGYHNPLVVPSPGSHVVVTGPWVLDAPHGWLEIHPLEQVEVLQ